MAKYRIIYDRDACIGAAACAALDPERWEMNEDGKADLLKGTDNGDGTWTLELDELPAEVKEGAEGCPVSAIKIKDLEKDEDIV
jgi:ferredoxin